MNPFLKRHKIDIIIIFIFLILPFIFFKDIIHLNSLIQGQADVTAYYLPIRQLLQNSISNLDFPLWNRFNFSGFPIIAVPEAYLFYPLPLIFNLIFPVVLAYNLNLFLHYSLGGIFLYFFLRNYKLNYMSCFLGGLVFMFSGVMITHRTHPTFIFNIIWIPLILLLLDKYRTSKRFEFLLSASIFYAISFLGAHPQIFLYSSIIILLFILYYSLIYEGIKNYKFLLSLLIFVIGIAIMSVQLFPSLELTNYSVRATMDYVTFGSYSFSLKSLPLLIFPYFFGNSFYNFANVPEYFGPWNYAEIIIYFGIITIPILIFGLFSKDKHKYLWIFLMIFAFLLILGPETPIYKIMFHVPIYNKFKVPARNWYEFSLAFAILTGFGFDYFLNNTKEKLKKITILSISFLSAILLIFFIFYYLFKSHFKTIMLNILTNYSDKISFFEQNIDLKNYSIFIPILLIIITLIFLLSSLLKKNKISYILILIMIFIDLFSFNFFFEKNSDAKYFKNNINQNSAISYLINKDFYRLYPVSPSINGYVFSNMKNIYLETYVITGYESLLLKDYTYITGLKYSSEDTTGWDQLLKNNKILSFLNVKYILLNTPNDNLQDFFKDFKISKNNNLKFDEEANYKIVFSDNNHIILENLNCLPRFFYIKSVIDVKNIEAVREILWDENQKLNNFNPRVDALIEEKDFKKTNFDDSSSGYKVVSYRDSKVTLKTFSKEDSFLVFSDVYYPGWKAYIDGKNTKIYKTNGILKGIYIPEGNHEINFIFIPTRFIFYVIISVMSLLTCITIIIFLNIKNRRLKYIEIIK